MRVVVCRGRVSRYASRLPLISMVALAALCASTLSYVSPASAAPQAPSEVYTCGSTSANNFFDGKQQAYGTGSYEGAYGDISTRYGAVCDTDHTANNFQNPWVMIAGAATNDGWVQSGYTRWYNSCTYFFSQVSRDAQGTGLVTKFGTTCVSENGTTHKYTEEWQSSCGCLKSLVDSSVYLSTSWNPYSYWTTPFSPEFYGEAVYLASDMPGNSANPTTFSNLHYQNISNDAWGSYGCGAFALANDGGKDRADGEEWLRTNSCPNFSIFTDTSPAEGSYSDQY